MRVSIVSTYSTTTYIDHPLFISILIKYSTLKWFSIYKNHHTTSWFIMCVFVHTYIVVVKLTNSLKYGHKMVPSTITPSIFSIILRPIDRSVALPLPNTMAQFATSKETFKKKLKYHVYCTCASNHFPYVKKWLTNKNVHQSWSKLFWALPPTFDAQNSYPLKFKYCRYMGNACKFLRL